MISNHLEICVVFNGTRKLVIFENNLQLDQFKAKLRQEFRISERAIKLIDIQRGAEITSHLSLREEGEEGLK